MQYIFCEKTIQYRYIHSVYNVQSQAYSLMEEMRERIPSVNMAFYINIQTIETVHATLGMPMKHGLGAETSQREQEQEEDGMEEEDSEPEELIEEDYSAVNLTTTGTSSC